MTENASAEYRQLATEARSLSSRTQTVARLRRSLGAIRARDYFGSPERASAERAVEALAARAEAAA